MLYLISIIMIIINLIYRKSKYIIYIDFIFLFIMLGFSYGSYDTMIYIKRYIYPENYENFTEPLFNYIILFFKSFDVGYRTFMLITSFIELIMIFKFIKKYSENNCYVLALFIIYPMMMVFEQLRFFMAFTIVLTGALDSLLQKGKFYRIKAIIYIIIASLIHSSSIFYLVFVIVDGLNLKNTIKLTMIINLFFLLFGISPQILNIISYFIGDTKLEIIERISLEQEGQFGCMAMAVAVFLEYVVYYIYAKKRKKELQIEEKSFEYMDTILKWNIISLIAIPLIWIFSVAFMRISTNLLILNYIGISKSMDYEKRFCTTKEKFMIGFITVVYSIMLFFFASHTEEAFRLNVIPFYEQNEFFNILLN